MLSQPLDLQSFSNNDCNVVPISAKLNINIDKLLESIEESTNKILGKKMTKLIYPVSEHQTRLRWLLENANVRKFYNLTEKDKIISIEVIIDEVSYRRYQHTFNDEFVHKK